jgi:hypothetical protein
MPPPAAAEVAVAQLVALALDVELDVELDEELDEQPAASSAAAATPTANLYDDLTSASCKASLSPKWIAAARKGPGRRYRNGLPTHLSPS